VKKLIVAGSCLPVRLFLVVVSLCVSGVAVSCGSGGSSPTPATNQSSNLTTPPTPANVAGNWQATAPNSIAFVLSQNGTALTGLVSGSVCGLTVLQGSVAGRNGALAINATVVTATNGSFTGETLSGTLTCGVSTSPFSANLFEVTGRWMGTFIFANELNNISAVFNLAQNAVPGGFPAVTGTASMSPVYGGSLGDPCLLSFGSQITGSIAGSSIQFTLGGTANFQGTISGNGTTLQGTVSVITDYGAGLSYNAPCGAGGGNFVDYGLGPVP
jgi:hypothetical protein